MAFELAEAYVQMTQRGFKTVLGVVNEIQQEMAGMTNAAGKSTAAVEGLTDRNADKLRELEAILGTTVTVLDGPLTAAAKNAGNELLQLADSAGQITPKGNEAIQTLQRIQSQLANVKNLGLEIDTSAIDQAVEELSQLTDMDVQIGQIDLQFLKEIEGLIPAIVEKAKDLQIIKKSFKEAGDAADDVESDFADIRDMIDSTKTELESVRSKIDDWKESASEAGGGFEGLLLKGGRLVGIVSLVAGAASKVYDWVLRWQEGASGFNRENERALDLMSKIAEARQRSTSNEIAMIGRILDVEKQRAELEERINNARTDNENKQKALEQAEAARNPGLFGQFADGKVNSELEPEFQRAKEDAEAAEEALKSYEAALNRLNNRSLDSKSAIEEQLKREKIAIEQGELALRAYELEKEAGFSKNQAQVFAIDEKFTADRRKELENQKAIEHSFEKQVQELRLRNIELREGTQAAEAQEDIFNGLSTKQSEELSKLRDKVREAKQLADEEERLRIEREASAASLENELLNLRLRAIAATKGKEAAARARDIALGRSEDEQLALAAARLQVDVAEFDKRNKDKNGNRTSQFVGVAQLVEKIQQQAQSNKDKKEAMDLAKRQASAAERLVDLGKSGLAVVPKQTGKVDVKWSRFGGGEQF